VELREATRVLGMQASSSPSGGALQGRFQRQVRVYAYRAAARTR
jgi:hypothetical protein